MWMISASFFDGRKNMKCKKRARKLFGILVALIIFTIPVKASNVDTGGGGTSGGTDSKTNVYSGGDFGVRFTIVDADTGKRAAGTRTVDYYKKDNKKGKDVYHFGAVNKLEYLNGKGLVMKKNAYNAGMNAYAYRIPELWNVIDSAPYGKKATRSQIVAWLSTDSNLKEIAKDTEITYGKLISGDYKLICEPIFYVTYQGKYYAMTAHEVAKFDEAMDGGLRKYFVTYSHKNIPLSLFLKKKTFGIKAYSGSKNVRVSNSTIKSSLGIAVMEWEKEEPKTEVETEDYVYRRNTEVITAVNVTATEEANPENPITVTFHIPGVGDRKVEDIIMPAGYTERVWVKWKTPDTPQIIKIRVSTSRGSSKGEITCRISKLDTLEPLNPTADDIRPTGFNLSADPTASSPSKIVPVQSYTWTRWEECEKQRELIGYDTKQEYKGTDPVTGEPIYETEHKPIYEYYWHFGTGKGRTPGEPTYYIARLQDTTKLIITPAETARRANKDFSKLKSGYGIDAALTTRISTNNTAAMTPAQTSVFYFPEFNYKGCWRLGDIKSSTFTDTMFQLPENMYSIYHTRAHFTPIWYPDIRYKVYVKYYDAWTPMGQLKGYTTADIEIKGSLWDDWHIGLVPNLDD